MPHAPLSKFKRRWTMRCDPAAKPFEAARRWNPTLMTLKFNWRQLADKLKTHRNKPRIILQILKMLTRSWMIHNGAPKIFESNRQCLTAASALCLLKLKNFEAHSSRPSDAENKRKMT